MKSKLYLKEEVENKDHTFGEAAAYYPVKIVTLDGTVRRSLFTENQVKVAMERAKHNEEDFPRKTLLEIIFGEMEQDGKGI